MFQNNQVEQKELQHCTGCLTSLNEGQFVNVFVIWSDSSVFGTSATVEEDCNLDLACFYD